MPRFRRMSRLGNVIHSQKEIFDTTNLGVAAGVITTTTFITVVNDYVGTVGTVPVGAKVFGIYLFNQIIPEAVLTNVDMYVLKRPAGVVNPVPGATGGDPARKYVLHEEKGIPGTNTAGAPPLTFRGVVRVPRGRQTMQEGDVMLMRNVAASAYDHCAKIIYKWYT